MDVDSILNAFHSLPEWAQAIGILVSGIITVATTFTAATPTKVDDTKLPVITKPLNVILGFLNMLAGNVGFNKNKDAE